MHEYLNNNFTRIGVLITMLQLFSKDGQKDRTVCDSGAGLVWEYPSYLYTKFHVTDQHATANLEQARFPENARHIRLTHDGKYIVYVTGDGTMVCLRRYSDNRLLARYTVYDSVARMAISANNWYVIVATLDNRLLTLVIADPDEREHDERIAYVRAMNPGLRLDQAMALMNETTTSGGVDDVSTRDHEDEEEDDEEHDTDDDESASDDDDSDSDDDDDSDSDDDDDESDSNDDDDESDIDDNDDESDCEDGDDESDSDDDDDESNSEGSDESGSDGNDGDSVSRDDDCDKVEAGLGSAHGAESPVTDCGDDGDVDNTWQLVEEQNCRALPPTAHDGQIFASKACSLQ